MVGVGAEPRLSSKGSGQGSALGLAGEEDLAANLRGQRRHPSTTQHAMRHLEKDREEVGLEPDQHPNPKNFHLKKAANHPGVGVGEAR